MNKAQEVIAWFKENGNWETNLWDLEKVTGEYKQVEYDITGQGRWETFNQAVWRLQDGSFLEVKWAEGSTEYQDSTSPDIELVEVEPYEETVTKYRAIK